VLDVCRDFRTTPASRLPAREPGEPSTTGRSANAVPAAEDDGARWPRIAALGRRAFRDARQVNQ
jgi:hypothetical protein